MLDAFVTIRGGVVEAVGVPRDESLPHLGYSGEVVRVSRIVRGDDRG